MARGNNFVFDIVGIFIFRRGVSQVGEPARLSGITMPAGQVLIKNSLSFHISVRHLSERFDHIVDMLIFINGMGKERSGSVR